MERARRSPEPIIRMVAHSRTDAQLLADLHARAREASGAIDSVLLEYDAPSQRFVPTSGTGQARGGSWLALPDSLALAFDILASGHPRQVGALSRSLPDLALHLPTDGAILAPVVAAGRPVGLLVLALEVLTPALEWVDQVSACADGFALALDRARHERQAARQEAVDTLLTAWCAPTPEDAPSTALDAWCDGLAHAFAADRVTFWTHDRTGQRVTVIGSSDKSHLRRPASTPTADTEALIVRALRTSVLTTVSVADPGPRGPAINVAVPLRGQRRALGVIVLHGMRAWPGDDTAVRALLERLASGASAVLDARQLLGATLGTYRERAALRERLDQSEALSHLVAGIAHELNNPLQAVLGHIELARKGRRVPPALTSVFKQVSREAARAARIVENLLLMSGSGQLRLRPVSIARAVTGALALRASACKRAGITVSRDIPSTLPTVGADAVLLRQVFLNLLQNAEHALAGREAPVIEVAASVGGPHVVVVVRDNGPGLPPDDVTRVFEPFYTTRESGIGLGLTLVRRVVKEFGGTIEAANHPDGGAIFTVSLPVTSVVD